MNEPRLSSFELLETSMSKLWDFGWFDVSHFRVHDPERIGDTGWSVVQAFWRDPLGQRCFASPANWGEPTDDRHGPYRMSRMEAGWYREVSPSGAKEIVDGVFDDPEFFGRPDAAQLVPVEAWLASLEESGDLLLHLEPPAGSDSRSDFPDVW